MPTIVFVSPKGGVGKTTAATVLATQLAKSTDVIVLDADPNQPIATWSKAGKLPPRLQVESGISLHNICDKIEEASAKATFVIVDCEGTANLSVGYAIGFADLVIVPTQGSQLDAEQAARALDLVKGQEKVTRRSIPHAILLTRTSSAIRPRTLAAVQSELSEHGIAMFATHLHERDAFKAIFSYGTALEDLDPFQVSNVEKAIQNAREFADEVLQLLRAKREQVQGEVRIA